MFRWLRSDPAAKLQKQYESKLKEAMESQRNGDMRLYAELSEQAESLRQSIEAIGTKSEAR